MPTLPPTERVAMACRVAASRVSSVLSGVGRGQRVGMAVRSAVTIPARTSGGRLAHPPHTPPRGGPGRRRAGRCRPRRSAATWAGLRPVWAPVRPAGIATLARDVAHGLFVIAFVVQPDYEGRDPPFRRFPLRLLDRSASLCHHNEPHRHRKRCQIHRGRR